MICELKFIQIHYIWIIIIRPGWRGPNMHPSSLLHHRSPLLIHSHPEASSFLSCIPLEPRSLSAPAAFNQLLILCFLILVRLFIVVFPGDMFIDGVNNTTDTVEPMVIPCSPM